MAIDIKDQDFDKEVLQSALPVLVDFWAPWCGPCKMLGPVVEEMAENYAGKIKIVKLNVDENPASASNYEILSIPALKFFKDGKVMDEMVGLQPREVLEDKIKKVIEG
jgi:thioredoxin